jgi:modification methylase
VTEHKLLFTDSRYLDSLSDSTVDLVVTSPPYPMIEMWDRAFSEINPEIAKSLNSDEGTTAFELMHAEIDRTWDHVVRLLKPGGWACINIGDATRSIGGNFQLYSNHTRITQALLARGLSSMPLIIWRKQTNAPNKFMGSGMLPAGAYVTLEHEYILLFRKGEKRVFANESDIVSRQKSSVFWEERNTWYSDMWDFKGTRQLLNHSSLRERSAAFPFELAYRLILMYSVRNDVVLDPFLGTGTTSFAAMATERNSIGIEIEPNFRQLINDLLPDLQGIANECVSRRLKSHIAFIEAYEADKGRTKHVSDVYGFDVVTSQERRIQLAYVAQIQPNPEGGYLVTYDESASLDEPLQLRNSRRSPDSQLQLL